MCKRIMMACRRPQDDDLTLGHHQTPSYTSPSSQTSKQGWRPLLWSSNRWKLSTTSLCCSLVIFMWTFPASTGAAQTVVPPPEPVRDTAYGKIQGYVREVLPGKFVEYYLGVPYAAPPVGDLRFENPVEPKPWDSILKTIKHPSACMQLHKSYVNEHRVDFDDYDEDCLYLNIYVPRTTKKGSLPVFAFVHGGSNVVGMAAMHDGDVFAAYTDVIVVMMNYRLTVFGFFTMVTPELPGNYGLMDQLLSLKWIQRNIGFFGGDENKVTLSGHSAGGGDVGLHTLSRLAKGLFRFSICQSGSGTANWAILKPDEDILKRVQDYVKRLDCLKGTSLDIKRCLRKRPAISVLSTPIELPPTGFGFFPIIYKYITDTPANLFARGPLNSETMMVGITKDEGTIAGLMMHDNFDKERFATMVIDNQHAFSHLPHIADLILYEYTQWDRPHLENNTSAKISMSQLFGDFSLTYPTFHCANLLAKRKFPVYFYAFYHRSTEEKRPDWVGVPHGEDIFYLFGSPLVGHPLRNYTNLDKEVSKNYMLFFSNFVKTGKAFVGTKQFKPYTLKDKLLIKFDSGNNTALVENATYHQPRRMAFWDSLIPRLQNKNSIEEKTQEYREEKQVRKTFNFQILTWFFVSLCLILMVTTGYILLMLYRRRKNNFPVPTSSLVPLQNIPANTAEPRAVVVDTSHLASKEATKKEQTNTEFSTKNA